MTNSRAGKQLELLDHHLATGTESTYTYTPSIALDMKIKYRQILVIITGKTTATLTLSVKVNAQTDYNYSQNLGDTTTWSTAVADASASINILAGGIVDGAVTFMSELKIVFNDAADLLMLHSESASPHEGNQQIYAEAQTAATTITSIQLLVSTSTWIAGTEITTYGILR